MNKKLITAFYLILNIFFSIVIVLLNKWLYVHTGFPNITLSMIHFVITSIGLIICEKFDVFCIKDIAIREMFFIAMAFCGFVVLTNLSLAHNTVGTYQVAKMLTTPCVIIMQMIVYNKHFSILVKLTLTPIILGVVMNIKQKEFQMDPMQLLYYQAPLSAVMLFFIVPFLEPIEQTFARSWSLIDIAMVILSGIIAFFVNLTSYWIIGKTSPLTYNMVGHFKFCLLLLGGSLIFHETLTINQVIGITLTLVGIILYAHVKMKDIQAVVADCEDKERKPLHKV
ncbi:Solute carrier family 35 member E3 [Melipona quadrifasciata]|uniref:Solute carrier family 35 member E3 n=1 Tax=Melipona quadrifasciata TaxID=166423 RepID=A0A0M8ZQI2_9HYME|nr:Solute carrier family 35 member E3 [Melipona quadrifasciata]